MERQPNDFDQDVLIELFGEKETNQPIELIENNTEDDFWDDLPAFI